VEEDETARERGKERGTVEVVENRHGAIPTSSAKLTLRNHGVSRRLLFHRVDDCSFFLLFLDWVVMKRGLATSIYIGFGQEEGEGQVDVIGVGWLVGWYWLIAVN
jgi:hypothetical protein